MISANKYILSDSNLSYFLDKRDLSDPIQGAHSLNLIIEKFIDHFKSQNRFEAVQVRRGEKISNICREFDSLFYLKESKIRGCDYARYLDEKRLLRTHTTPLALDVLREAASHHSGRSLYICPGICFRKDVIAKNRVPEPHKIDFLFLRKGEELFTSNDLRREVEAFVQFLRPGLLHRLSVASHPFTQDGLSVEVQISENHWLKLLECGLASERLLVSCGLNPKSSSAIIIGAGLERLAMVVKNIPDMRVLYSNSPEIASQMQDLRSFTSMVSITPFSYALEVIVPNDWSLVDASDELRVRMQENAIDIESLKVVRESYEQGDRKKVDLFATLSSVEKELDEKASKEIAELIKRTVEEQ